MRKGILFMLLCLTAIVAVACGGGNDAGNNGGGECTGGECNGGNGNGDTADAYALYKKEGRKWKTKSVMKMEGMDDQVSFTEYEIISVADDHAVQKMTMLDAEGNPNEHVPPSETKIEFTTAEATDTDGESAPEPTKETIKVEAGEFECYVTEQSGTKSWSSVKYPGLAVKMESDNMTMELVEFSE